MGLSVKFKQQKNYFCPDCGKLVVTIDEDEVPCGGSTWYEYLEKIGYYVPYNDIKDSPYDWYGKDMVLDKEKIEALQDFICMFEPNCYDINKLLKMTVIAKVKDDIALSVNADW